MNSQDTPSKSKPPRGRLALIAVLAAVVAGGAYVAFMPMVPTAPGGTCPVNPDSIALKPLARGEVAAFMASEKPQAFPALSFTQSDGSKVSLDAFKGKTVLLNLWATWCVPCRKEMPALDTLQAELGGPDFEVVAISVDSGGPDKPKKWLADNGIKNLSFYTDASGEIMKTLSKSGHVVGLPTTILINADGCQSGILKGGAEWASEDALKLIKAALPQKS